MANSDLSNRDYWLAQWADNAPNAPYATRHAANVETLDTVFEEAIEAFNIDESDDIFDALYEPLEEDTVIVPDSLWEEANKQNLENVVGVEFNEEGSEVFEHIPIKAEQLRRKWENIEEDDPYNLQGLVYREIEPDLPSITGGKENTVLVVSPPAKGKSPEEYGRTPLTSQGEETEQRRYGPEQAGPFETGAVWTGIRDQLDLITTPHDEPFNENNIRKLAPTNNVQEYITPSVQDQDDHYEVTVDLRGRTDRVVYTVEEEAGNYRENVGDRLTLLNPRNGEEVVSVPLEPFYADESMEIAEKDGIFSYRLEKAPYTTQTPVQQPSTQPAAPQGQQVSASNAGSAQMESRYLRQ